MASEGLRGASRRSLHVVVLDRYAGSWFIVNSSVVGYDYSQNVRWEECRVAPQEQSSSPRTERQALWIVGVVVAVAAVLFVINLAFVHRPLWDWLQLLIVPAVLAGGGLWFNAQQRERAQQIANARAQDEALQAYLDQMSDLLIPNEGRPSLYDEHAPDSLWSVARARTLTVLPRLDGNRKGRVVQFLYEADLIAMAKRHRILDLGGADLSDANLSGANLERADLGGANLRGANVSGADLGLVNLGLGGPGWNAQTNLRGANLREARLFEAVLFKADLSGAVVLIEQLREAESLESATMPNGQKYEDWRKDQEGHKEDAKYS